MSEIRNLINITDLTVEEIDGLIATADDIVYPMDLLEEIVLYADGTAGSVLREAMHFPPYAFYFIISI